MARRTPRGRKTGRKPAAKKPAAPKKKAAKRAPARKAVKAASKPKSKPTGAKAALTCPDCGFVAAHPMGLGRHRSARHGAVSARAARRRSGGGSVAAPTPTGWLTRQDAAKRAGVHYNTIRQWERTGLLNTTRKRGTRGSLIQATDLQKVLSERATVAGAPVAVGGGGADAAAVASLQRSYDALVTGLEGLLATLRDAGTVRRRPGRPLGSKNRPKSAPVSRPRKRGKPKRR